MIRIAVLFIALLPLSLMGQDCNDPLQLCAAATVSASVDAPNPVAVGCFNHAYTTYFTFTTNTDVDNTGSVEITVSNIACGDPTAPASVTALIVEIGAGGDPCVPAGYLPVSPCAQGTDGFVLVSQELDSNTEYLVLLGSDNDPALFDCGFDAVVNGQAVNLNVCCSQQIVLGQQVDLEVTGGNAVPGYIWEPSITLDVATGTTVVATPPESTDYTVTGDVGPCEGVTATVSVLVGPPVSIPNTITPNGDDVNDLWRIAGIGQFPNAQVTVFDRWGQIVFKDIGYAQPWDGKNKGRTLPTATYYYVIELNSDVIEIPPITGAIALIH